MKLMKLIKITDHAAILAKANLVTKTYFDDNLINLNKKLIQTKETIY